MATEAQDRSDILKLHKDWWEANCDLDIPRMRPVFPVGDAYLMFNLNGHPYFGIEEKSALWEWYRSRTDIGMPTVKIMRLTISGELAWLAAEGLFPSRQLKEFDENGEVLKNGESEQNFPPVIRVRATEVYQRDNSAGDPEWTMWHFHCSPVPPETEPRPWAGDTYAERGGLGWTPDGEPLSVIGPDQLLS
jgi:hypothetical protein